MRLLSASHHPRVRRKLFGPCLSTRRPLSSPGGGSRLGLRRGVAAGGEAERPFLSFLCFFFFCFFSSFLRRLWRSFARSFSPPFLRQASSSAAAFFCHSLHFPDVCWCCSRPPGPPQTWAQHKGHVCLAYRSLSEEESEVSPTAALAGAAAGAGSGSSSTSSYEEDGDRPMAVRGPRISAYRCARG